MWAWIRKNIFRIYRGGKHRTDGLSTLERAAFQAEPSTTVEQDRLAYAIKSPVMAVPVVAGPDGYREPTAEQRVTTRRDYVARHVFDETVIFPEDWTQ